MYTGGHISGIQIRWSSLYNNDSHALIKKGLNTVELLKSRLPSAEQPWYVCLDHAINKLVHVATTPTSMKKDNKVSELKHSD